MEITLAMPEKSTATNMSDEDSFSCEEMAVQKPNFRNTSPSPSIRKLENAYDTLPGHTTAKPRDSIIKPKLTDNPTERIQSVQKEDPGKLVAMDRAKA